MNRPPRLVLRVPAHVLDSLTFAKAQTVTGEHIPAAMARAKSFNVHSAMQRHTQDEASWHSRLDHTERSGLHHYTDKHTTGPRMNNLHRWGEKHEGDEFTPAVSRNADRALGKARVGEKHGIIVHRGMSGGFAAKMAADHDKGDGPAGKSFTEKGYLSTSLVPKVAHSFMHQTLDPENAVTIHHVIHAPRGTRMGSVRAVSQAPHEHEMLAARGAHMQHIAFTEHDPHPDTVKAVAAHAAATGRTVGHGPGQVRPPRHFIMHSVITHHEPD